MTTEDSDFEIKEPDSYGHKAGDSFSHSQLIMSALRKCLESGSKEMTAGYFNERTDKRGNIVRTYVADTRKEFIETVKTLLMIMADDLDDEFDKQFKKIKEELDKKYKEYCEKEERDWINAPLNVQIAWKKQGIVLMKSRLNQNFPYWIEFLEDKVDSYREIVAACKKLTQRKDYYREEMYEA